MARNLLQVCFCTLLVVSSFAFAQPPSPAGGNFFEVSENQSNHLELSLTPRFGDLIPNMTIEAWVFLTRLPPLGPMASIVHKNAPMGFRLYFARSLILPEGKEALKIAFATCEEHGCGVIQKNLPDFQFNQWHHLALTHSQPDGELCVYIDGIRTMWTRSEEPEDAAYFASEGVLRVGEGSFDGAIDELQISNEVIYKGQFRPPRRLRLKKSTLALWHFDEPRNSPRYHDASGRGNTLFNSKFPVQPFGQLIFSWGNLKRLRR